MIDRAALLATLYRKAYRIRRAEQAIIAHYAENEMKTPMHMSMGEEAIAAGVCTALAPGDKLFGYYRSHALYLARTDETERFFGEMYGRAHGALGGRGGSMHLAAPEVGLLAVSAIVASTIAPAVGAAFAERMRATGNVVAAFFGDGAMEEGVFWESLNVACVYRLPVLFVCEDNGLAVDVTAPERQGYRSIRKAVAGFACEYVTGDTSDAEKVHALAARAREATLANDRPVFLHLKYYRLLQHIGIQSDFDGAAAGFEKAGYRSRAEYEKARRRDPVRMTRHALARGGTPPAAITALEAEIDREIEASLAKARAGAAPDPCSVTEHVFAGMEAAR